MTKVSKNQEQLDKIYIRKSTMWALLIGLVWGFLVINNTIAILSFPNLTFTNQIEHWWEIGTIVFMTLTWISIVALPRVVKRSIDNAQLKNLKIGDGDLK